MTLTDRFKGRIAYFEVYGREYVGRVGGFDDKFVLIQNYQELNGRKENE